MDNELGRFVDSMAALVAFVTPAGEVEYFNREFLDYTGRTFEDLRNWVETDAVHPDDVPTILQAFGTLDQRLPYDELIRIRSADGEYRRFRTRMAPCFDADGAATRWCAVMADVEEQMQAEALLEGEVRLLEMVALGRPLLEVMSALCRLTEDLLPGRLGSILLVEPGHGFQAASPLDGGADVLDGRAIDPAFDPCSLSVVLKAPVIAPDIQSDARWAASPWPALMAERGLRAGWSTPILSEAGEVAGVFAIYRREPADPTAAGAKLIDRFVKIAGIAVQRARADEALRASEGDLRRALWHVAEGERLSKTGSFTAGLQLDNLRWSQELFRICEIDPATPASVEIVRERVHPDDLPRFDAEMQRAVREGVSDFNLRLLTPIAGEKHLRAAAHVVEDSTVIGFVQDVTESKLAEQELRRSAASLVEGEFLSKTGSYVWLMEESEPVLSHELRVIFGYEPDEPVTMADIWGRMIPEDLPNLDEDMEAARTGHPTASLFRMQMRDGSTKHLRSVTRGARMQDGHLEMIGSVQDITESKRAEEALTRARSELAHVARVATLNAMTASIAHEVAQPLSGIVTNASTALRMLAAHPPNVAGAAETARRSLRDANRASEVIRRLRDMFSTKAPALEMADLNDVARDVIALSAAELQRKGALLQTAFADELPRVNVDRVQFQQVILNLLLNGADAMMDVQDRPRALLVETGLGDDGLVKLAVRDAGVGVDPHSVEKLFEAFYTTKPDGMGVGLSICRSIVESHHGRLWAEANDGPGATFTFHIPTGQLAAHAT